ncbi:hypothetical protein KC338_g220 [Hortaea werneckii]|nr:hypothetical protein KC338_g220 [Hortaea werneckii]
METSGLTPSKEMSDGKGTMPIAGPLPSASKRRQRRQDGALRVDAVPEDDLVHGDCWRRAELHPVDVVLGDDAPRGVVLAPNVGAHVAQLNVVLGGSVVLVGQVTEVVGLAEVVPCQELNDVWLEGVVTNPCIARAKRLRCVLGPDLPLLFNADLNASSEVVVMFMSESSGQACHFEAELSGLSQAPRETRCRTGPPGRHRSVGHVRLVPVDVALAVAHIERVHELETHLLGGSEGVVDTVGHPAQAGLALRRDPVHGKAVNAHLLRRGHVLLPLVDIVGVSVLDHEVSEDICGVCCLQHGGRSRDDREGTHEVLWCMRIAMGGRDTRKKRSIEERSRYKRRLGSVQHEITASPRSRRQRGHQNHHSRWPISPAPPTFPAMPDPPNYAGVEEALRLQPTGSGLMPVSSNSSQESKRLMQARAVKQTAPGRLHITSQVPAWH